MGSGLVCEVMHSLLAYQCCVTKTSQSNIKLGTSGSCAASLHCSSFLPIQFTSRQHQHLSWCSPQPHQNHQHSCHTTAQSQALSNSPAPLSCYCPVTSLFRLTSTPFILLPGHHPCQNHQHPFPTTAQSPALSESPAPLSNYCPALALSESPAPLSYAQSPALSDSAMPISCYCPVTSLVRLANTPFILLPSH